MSSSSACGCGHTWTSHNQYGCVVRDGGIAGHDTYCMCAAQPPEMAEAARETRRVEALRDGCNAHRRYQIKRPPRTACEKCWRLWFKVNP